MPGPTLKPSSPSLGALAPCRVSWNTNFISSLVSTAMPIAITNNAAQSVKSVNLDVIIVINIEYHSE